MDSKGFSNEIKSHLVGLYLYSISSGNDHKSGEQNNLSTVDGAQTTVNGNGNRICRLLPSTMSVCIGPEMGEINKLI